MSLPPFLLTHTLRARPKLGVSSTGDVFGPWRDLECMAQGGVRLVRNAAGAEVTSTLTLFAQPDEDLPPGSEVQHAGDTTTVIGTILHDAPGLPLPEHLEVMCE